MKIVVPVDNDKKTIVKRTGKASFFAVYEDEKLIEFFENDHAKEGHDHDDHHHHDESEEEVEHHRKDILNLKGCDVILAQAVGPNMAKALESIGLKVQKISRVDGSSADEVVEKFLKGELKRQ